MLIFDYLRIYVLQERLIKQRKPIKNHGVRAERARITAILLERGDREGDREHDGRSRLTTDYLGSVDPDLLPLEPSPWWTRAPVPLLLLLLLLPLVWRLCRLLIEKGLGTR